MIHKLIINNISDLYSQLDETPLVPYASSRDTDDSSWYGTPNYESSVQLLKKGDQASFNQIKEAQGRYQVMTNFDTKSSTVRDIIGSNPCVPAYILGVPKNMYRHVPVSNPVPSVTLVYDRGMASRYDSGVLADDGVFIAEYIKQLEIHGIATRLYIGVSCYYYGHYYITMTRFKDYNERMLLYPLAYPLVNPSFLRRTTFQLYESLPEFVVLTSNGYGKDTHHKERIASIKQVIKDSKVLVLNHNEITRMKSKQ